MKRLLDDDQAPNRDLLDALRERSDDASLEDRVLSRIHAGTRRPARLRLRPAAAVAGVSAGIVAIVIVWRALHGLPATVPQISPPPVASVADLAVVTPAADLAAEAPTIAPPRPKKTHQVAPASSPTVTPVPMPPASAEQEESRLLLEAYRAMRQDHDEEAAIARVDEYLRRFPKGALSEEALVIALDATNKDAASARVYAQKYLARFPDGRHAGRAAALLR